MPLAKQLHHYLKSVEDFPPAAKSEREFPLPSKEDSSELEKKLSSSPIVASKRLGGGINDTRVITLSGGIPAVFKVDRREGRESTNELGAWKVAQIVGMTDLVPPVAIRDIANQQGTIEHGSVMAFVGGEVAGRYDSKQQFDGEKDLARSAAFDYVIGNEDRHTSNWLVEGDKLHLIDHGLAFPEEWPYWGGSRFIEEAKERKLPVAEYAAPYIKLKTPILATLNGIGMGQNYVKEVGKRIDVLSKVTSWAELR